MISVLWDFKDELKYILGSQQVLSNFSWDLPFLEKQIDIHKIINQQCKATYVKY